MAKYSGNPGGFKSAVSRSGADFKEEARRLLEEAKRKA
jgi:hypothetical protein